MRIYIRVIYLIAVSFAITLPFSGSAQYFNFDTTNAIFLKVDRDINNGIVVIKLKPKEKTRKEIFNCENSPAVISFESTSKNWGGKRAVCNEQKYMVTKVVEDFDHTIIIKLLFYKMNSINENEKIMLDLLPNEAHKNFKFLSVRTQ